MLKNLLTTLGSLVNTIWGEDIIIVKGVLTLIMIKWIDMSFKNKEENGTTSVANHLISIMRFVS